MTQGDILKLETQFPFPVRKDTPLREIDKTDEKTPDFHVARDSRLIRLTGSHPFNCEAPLDILFKSGFLTPISLHFVRNHGPVPDTREQEGFDWEFEVTGLVEKPLKLTLRQLVDEFEQVTIPITLACAGNRRKEQNMVKKGTGFNWGAGGVSTSLWTGVLIRDVLRRAVPKRTARFLWMEGADKLPNGSYGTSVRLPWAMDFDRAIMLAWKQNGNLLEPDHGRPLRVVVPGVIGGRSVKWLKKLIISDRPSENFYHIHDNRVLPTMVTPEMAKEDEKWWLDERYAISNLNIQSAITVPEHGSAVNTADVSTFTIRGYAYNGGGIRVGRVEVSIDGGSSWRLADIDYPEDTYRQYNITELFGGKIDMADRYLCFCWCFWEVTVGMSELCEAKDILVRAMDIDMNVQPRNMYWNVSSMLNNWWYRVAIIKIDDNHELRFEHPVLAALQKGGWMDRVNENGADILDNYGESPITSDSKKARQKKIKQVVKLTRDEVMGRIITGKELDEHSNETNPWIVVEGQVYDVTEYLEFHPGGPESITMVAGTNVTEDFMAIHSDTAKALLAKYHIGTLEADATSHPTPLPNGDHIKSVKTDLFLDAKNWKSLQLKHIEVLSKDTRVFTFDLEHSQQTSGLPVGKHLFIRAKDHREDGSYVMRAYTPVSSHKTKGVLKLLIKIYFPSETNPGGRMTGILETLHPGDTLDIKGPTGSFEYHGHGNITHKRIKKSVKRFYMISGGSGITPCYQVLREMVDNHSDSTEATLLFGNRYEEDILCREDLDAMVKNNIPRGNINVKYWLSAATIDDNWPHNRGRINQTVLSKELKGMKDSEDSMLLVCGPDGMLDTVKEWIKTNAIPEDRLVIF